MKWFEGYDIFEGYQSLRKLRKRMAVLAPIYHPDREVGDLAIMKEVSAEYDDLKHWMHKLLEKESEGRLWSNGKKEPIKYKRNSDEYEFEYQKKDDYDFTSDFYNASCEEQTIVTSIMYRARNKTIATLIMCRVRSKKITTSITRCTVMK